MPLLPSWVILHACHPPKKTQGCWAEHAIIANLVGCPIAWAKRGKCSRLGVYALAFIDLHVRYSRNYEHFFHTQEYNAFIFAKEAVSHTWGHCLLLHFDARKPI